MAKCKMNIPQDKLRAIPIAIPSIEEQTKMVKLVKVFLKNCDAFKSQFFQARSITENLSRSAITAITGTPA